MHSVLFVSKHKIAKSGTTQLRCNQPAEYLASLGYRTRVDTIYRAIPGKQGTVILHRVALDKYSSKFISYAKMRGNTVLYDIDDLIFTKKAAAYLKKIGKTNYFNGYERYQQAIQKCDAVIVSTQFLANKVRPLHSDVYIIRNALGFEFLKKARKVFDSKQYRNNDLVTIGYLSGSNTHNEDFKIIESALLKLLGKCEHLKLLLVGRMAFSEEFHKFGARFEHRSFIPYKNFAEVFQEVDLNLIPLDASEEFCNAKSELKYIEAGACGVPSIASPTHTFLEVISNGVNGLIAEDDHWYQKIHSLIVDPEKRSKLGAAARTHVLTTYSPEIRGKEWANLIEEKWLDTISTTKIKQHSQKVFLRGVLEISRVKTIIKSMYRRSVRLR